MSIVINAAGRGKDCDYKKIKNIVNPIARNMKFELIPNNSHKRLTLKLTDNGIVDIECKEEGADTLISIESQTSVMGAGFHKYVVDFIDFLSDLSEIKFEVSDETDYYHNRDFETLRSGHFENWLKNVVTLLAEKDNKETSFLVNWDMSWAKPEDVPSVIMTPFGRFSISFLMDKLNKEGSSALADIFFPCPDETIDWIRLAWYDMLYLLWNKCYFMPSSRSEEDDEINSKILTLIDFIINSGKDWPIPHKEYLELCRLADRKPCDLGNVSDYRLAYPIGFRRGLVSYTVGKVTFKLPGSYLKFDDGDSWGYWNVYSSDSLVRIMAIDTKEDTPDFVLKNSVVVEEGKIKGGRYALIDAGFDDSCHIAQIQLVTRGQFTLFTIASGSGVGKRQSLKDAKKFIGGLSISVEDLVETISKLHDDDNHQKIVELLTVLPGDEMTDEYKSLLARAYNNLEEYDKALSLLMEIREGQESEALWNYRVGYAYFYKENYPKAMRYFRKALEIDPNDESAKWFIDQCSLSVPFSKRVRDFWKWFGRHSDELEALLNRKEDSFNKVRELMGSGLDLLGGDVYYNIGGNNELTLCVEDNRECFYLYPYLVSKMPEQLQGKWTVYPCKQPIPNADFVFGMYGKKINVVEIMVGFDYDAESNTFDIRYYHPALLELDENAALNAFYIILEHIVGEGAGYNYINEVNRADDAEGMFSIGQLATAMKFTVEEAGKEYLVKPALSYSLYAYQSEEEEENRLRFDIITGTTRYMALNREYVAGKHDIYEGFVSKGAVPLMLILTQPEGMSNKDFIDFRHIVEDRLQALFDSEVIAGEILGGAYGSMGLGYIDLLLYDGKQFIDYIRDDKVLDSLLRLGNGTVCHTEVLYKDFTQESPVLKIR